MLDIGWSELLVVAVVAIVVVGPKDLPKLMRSFGFYAGKLRRAASDFQRQFDEAMAESEADEVRKNIEAIRSGMGGTVDLDAPTDKPVMMPTPAPAAIEEAIVPPLPKPKPASPKPSKLRSAKPLPSPKRHPRPRRKPKPRRSARLRAKRSAKAEPKP